MKYIKEFDLNRDTPNKKKIEEFVERWIKVDFDLTKEYLRVYYITMEQE